MEKAIRLKNFSDFIEAASAADVVIFQVTPTEGTDDGFHTLLVYAARYYWREDVTSPDLAEKLEILKEMRAKEAVGSEYYDRLFR